MDRRAFTLGLAGLPAVAMAARVSPRVRTTHVYHSFGSTIGWLDLDAPRGVLMPRGTLELPSVVQYGWRHPLKPFLYVATSDSERGARSATGARHLLQALRLAPDGTPSPYGEPAILRQRPVHLSLDHSGRFAFIAYNAPANVSVHHILPDGRVGEEVPQPAPLDVGIFTHQIRALPSNRAVLTVARGNRSSATKPLNDPGSLHIFGLNDGRLSPQQTVVPGTQAGRDYGPRHVDFHPTRPWMYALLELQNAIHMYPLTGDTVAPEPGFVVPSTQTPVEPGFMQVAGAIHVHPRGHVLYCSNRVSATISPVVPFPFTKGENSIAVFAIDPRTGALRPIQFADPHGFHVRTFAITPDGRHLIAASLAAMSVARGATTETVPAGLSVFRIADDGRLTFVSRHDIALAPGTQQMWVTAL